ncbi:uncharacterized protein LOC100827509 [Brachypodium distachyon]|uniref:uncharacterized protein LOC100827509 n=1 Tax=Brachypodium distachyon TaxID=15368 RepID=UPI000D0CF2F9|nr:uncharacterized protein LOC100827509 [Brachypodium distachyon]|eukprot:XP_024318630.1 uncharacterized protein LOC100827509 [Brachypodium distachyon]
MFKMVFLSKVTYLESCIVYDWESPELTNMLSTFSSKNFRKKCIYLLEVLDKYWDGYYSTKSRSLTSATHCGEKRTVESSFMRCVRNFKWIASSMDDGLHYPRDLFCDLGNVRSLLGNVAPYAKPMLSSKSLQKDIGFKTKVSYGDALLILKHWIASQSPFSARMDQMCKFYAFLSEGAANGEINIKRDFLALCSIFTPLHRSRSTDLVTGRFMPSKDLYWHDPTGCSEMADAFVSVKRNMFPRRMLSMAYPSLHEFFTEILLQLSSVSLPSQVGNHVFRVFVRWADDLQSGSNKMNRILYLKESLQKLETTVLPTVVDKWVSLHPSFGLLCWADNDELKKEFNNSSEIDFIQFGELSLDDKQTLNGRVAALMDILGIPALSKVVDREAIFDGAGNNREKASLISWPLPYMQRYIYKMHRDTYNRFQQNEAMKLSRLEVIVVQKLFYKYTLKKHDSSSKRRFECQYILQGNILYATQEVDPHSVFLELSRLFFDGSVDLHCANFLHMIKTMADSGSTVKQIEFFIVNNQKVPELPEQEPVWSFSSSFVAKEIQMFTSQTVQFQPPHDPSHILKRKRDPGIISSNPLSDPKTAPDLRTPPRSQQYMKVNDMALTSELSKPVKCGHMEDTSVSTKLEGVHVVKKDLMTENMSVEESTMEVGDEPACLNLEEGILPSLVDETELTNIDEKLADVAEEKDNLDTGPPAGRQLGAGTPGEATIRKTDERSRTGRLDEAVVHQYLVGQLGSNNVKWVNEENESGLPYDILITSGDGTTEYVEVKATVASSKDWFHITPREWQFALEKGDLFSIAHVLLKCSDKANIVMLKNPQKLCQQKFHCDGSIASAGGHGDEDTVGL